MTKPVRPPHGLLLRPILFLAYGVGQTDSRRCGTSGFIPARLVTYTLEVLSTVISRMEGKASSRDFQIFPLSYLQRSTSIAQMDDHCGGCPLSPVLQNGTVLFVCACVCFRYPRECVGAGFKSIGAAAVGQ